jgi:hypothetical protein
LILVYLVNPWREARDFFYLYLGMDLTERENLAFGLTRTGIWKNDQGKYVYGYVARQGRMPIQVTTLDVPALEDILTKYFTGYFNELSFVQEDPFYILLRGIKHGENNLRFAIKYNIRIEQYDIFFKLGILDDVLASLKNKFSLMQSKHTKNQDCL